MVDYKFLPFNQWLMKDDNTPQGQWSSSLGFILAASGAAVGLGNIWKFPYIAGENGGGAFVLVYLFCVVFVGVPLMMAEVMLGRAGKKNPELSFKKLASRSGVSKQWRFVGFMGIVASILVLSYYSVIAGWAMQYVLEALKGSFYQQSSQGIDKLFETFISSPYEVGFWHTVIMVATIGIVAMGVEKGLERAVKFMFPSMLALLLIIVGYSMNTGYFAHGLTFLFYPDFTKITAQGVLTAVGHAFFTLSLAVGTIMMYGAYLPRHVSIVKTSFAIAIADTLIALVAGLAIFPIVFSHNLTPSAGPGLIFKSLPLAFGHMPYGTFVGSVFFIMLVFAAFTSAISLLEPSVAWLVETFHIKRVKAAYIMGFIIWILGFATVFSFNIWQQVTFLGHNLFNFLDNLTANYMLPIGGLLTAIFAAWKYKESKQELELDNTLSYKLWHYSLGFLTPIAIVLVFLNLIGIF